MRASLLDARNKPYFPDIHIQHLFPRPRHPQVLNEHTFVVPENLLCFLRRIDGPTQGPSSTAPRHLQDGDGEGEGSAQQPLFLGHRLTLEDGTAFHSGALWLSLRPE